VAGGGEPANFDQPDFVWIGYPIRTLNRIAAPDERARARTDDSLDIVLGHHRATILRSLDQPCAVGELADAMFYAPTTLTYHCKMLLDAGLIARERNGRQILLSRTERGSEMLGLSSDG
jgi:DNA-binding MarR family transcriptional regulator